MKIARMHFSQNIDDFELYWSRDKYRNMLSYSYAPVAPVIFEDIRNPMIYISSNNQYVLICPICVV